MNLNNIYIDDEYVISDKEKNINLFAQGVINLDKLISWFDKHNQQEKRDIVNLCWSYIQNTHPSKNELLLGISTSEQKDTHTVAIIIKKYSFNEAYHKIMALPDDELNYTFVVLCSIFKITDTRRRECNCKGKCSHYWHNLK